jgi:hypothetical protein
MRWADGEPALTDVDGRFVVRKLTRGTYTLRAYRKGGGEAFVEHVEVGSTGVTLTIETPAAIAGTVTIAGAGAPEAFTIVVGDAKSGFRRDERFYRTGGAWAVRDLPEGTLRVSVIAPEGTDFEDITLARGEERAGVRFELAVRARLTGRVIADDDARPVPGMTVVAQEIKGEARSAYRWGEAGRTNVTDAEGRFEIDDAPAGRIRVLAMPQDWDRSEYYSGRVVVDAAPGKTTELPPITVLKRRVKPMEKGGDLGFETMQRPPEAEPEDTRWVVSAVSPEGPAAAGLRVGDEIVTVDGHDVRGENAHLFHKLTEVPEGTTVTLGILRGQAPGRLAVTAGKPAP